MQVVLLQGFSDGDAQHGGKDNGDSRIEDGGGKLGAGCDQSGSVGNSLGVNRAHYLILEDHPGGVDFITVSLAYDNEEAARIARNTPDLPGREAYIREITTGIYSR